MASKRETGHLRRRNGWKPHVPKQCLPKAKCESRPYGGARKPLGDRTCTQPCTLGVSLVRGLSGCPAAPARMPATVFPHQAKERCVCYPQKAL